ncbi:MAG: glycosyltransferase family 39 protein [bacterium]|nr:glycosyltransferase family 39 protein [bacterium]
MISWIKKNKFSFLLLVLILLTGTFLRFYQIQGHATFLGDEGRDALIVKRMIVDHQWTLLGPTASFGNLYLGPIYYYFMIPGLLLANFNPVGPAMVVASFGVLALFLVWKISYDFFGKPAAVCASGLYAISQVIITHTRSSWNPNPMPFFSLLAIYSLYKTIQKRNGKWLILVGGSLGVALQLHYIAFALIASIFLIILLFRPKIKAYWYGLGIISFLTALSPQIMFELRHNFIDTRAMIDFFLHRGDFTASAGIGLDKLAPFTLYLRLFDHLVATDINVLGLFLGIVSGLTAFYFLYRQKSFQTKNLGLSILLLWLFLGMIIIPLYRGKIHDHYLGFLFPTPFILLGFLFSRLWTNKVLRLLGILVLLLLLGINLKTTNPISGIGPNYQIDRASKVAKSIADDVGDKKFNLALVSATGDYMAMNYRYFLELDGKKPEDYGNFDNIDVLYVIEEKKWVTPSELGLWEVGTFGPNIPVRDWTFDFQVMVFRLEHKK